MKHLIGGLLLLTTTPVWALLPYAATPAEQAMCQARVYSRLGGRNENTIHMHHYCDGLRFIDRAYSSMGDKVDRQHYLGVAINNLNYVLSHTKEDYAMRGEVHLAKARALKLAGKKAEAVAEFNNALRYDLDSPDAYQALADHFQETGNKPKALELVIEGLRRNPNAKGLKRRYTELGGKLPYPAPVEPVPAERLAAKPDETVASGLSPASSAAPSADASETPAVVESIAPAKIGSPKNPYCRFCPD